jgi:hypothetical protein
MNSATDRGDVPDIVLERYRFHELPTPDAESLERRLREEPALRRRLEAIEASDLEMERAGMPDRLAAGVRIRARSRAESPAPTRLAAARWLVPAAIVVAAVAVVVVSLPSPDRVKGLKPSLTLFRKTAVGTETLEPGSALRAGDVVRVAYQGAARPYGVILSIDGRGGVTLHLPTSGRSAARLQPGDRVLLEQAYELDDAPRWESFYLVTGKAPFEVAPILDAARRAAAAAGGAGPPALAIGPGLEQVSLLFVKKGK